MHDGQSEPGTAAPVAAEDPRAVGTTPVDPSIPALARALGTRRAHAGVADLLTHELTPLTRRLGGDAAAVLDLAFHPGSVELRAVAASPPLPTFPWRVPCRHDDRCLAELRAGRPLAVGTAPSWLAGRPAASARNGGPAALAMTSGVLAPVLCAGGLTGLVVCWSSRPGFPSSDADAVLVATAACLVAEAAAMASDTGEPPGARPDPDGPAPRGVLARAVEPALTEFADLLDQLEAAVVGLQQGVLAAGQRVGNEVARRATELAPSAGAGDAAADRAAAPSPGTGRPPPGRTETASTALPPADGEAGAVGLVEALERLADELERTGRHRAQEATDQLLGALAGASGALSTRQAEVLTLLASGYRVKGIAERLGVTTSTVRNHVSVILRRLGLRNQAELTERLVAIRARHDPDPDADA